MENEMPRYKCHKEVRALKIKSIEPSGCAATFLMPEDERFRSIEVSSEWMLKHNPQPGGYYVVYQDGYTSYSPAQAFEEGYNRLTDAQVPSSVTANAFAVLRYAMQKDSEYAWSWHCNIAMASVDKGLDHAAANQAAAQFMKNCFGVDTSQSDQYTSLGIESL